VIFVPTSFAQQSSAAVQLLPLTQVCRLICFRSSYFLTIPNSAFIRCVRGSPAVHLSSRRQHRCSTRRALLSTGRPRMLVHTSSDTNDCLSAGTAAHRLLAAAQHSATTAWQRQPTPAFMQHMQLERLPASSITYFVHCLRQPTEHLKPNPCCCVLAALQVPFWPATQLLAAAKH
jgi:hypothetical protein